MSCIDYQELFATSQAQSADTGCLAELLSDAWGRDYRQIAPQADLYEVESRGWTYLLDFAGNDESAPQVDRAVACWGLSERTSLKREASYQRGYPVPTGRSSRPLDKGHMMPNQMGGDVSQNIYPQDRALNRGWSEDGRRYRALEREAARTPGTFFFCKLEYDDLSDCPSWVEIGVLRRSGLHVERFRNKFD